VLLDDVPEVVSELRSCLDESVSFCLYDEKEEPHDTLPVGQCTTLVEGDGVVRKPPKHAFSAYEDSVRDYIQTENQIRVARHIEHKTTIREIDEADKSIRAYNSITRTMTTVWFENGIPVSHECDCEKDGDVTCEHVAAVLRNLPDNSAAFCGKPTV
jgi:hypothetical protein